jgi:formyltetrahydrofolate deformylase
MTQKILLTECQDRPGLIAVISDLCFKNKLNVIKNNEFVDPQSNVFFMRTVFETREIFDEKSFLKKLESILPKNSKCRIANKQPKRLVIMVTTEAHCLGDLLMKNYIGTLDVEIAAVISNHQVLEPLVKKFDIPFHFISHENITREQHEELIFEQIQKYQPDILVLAKYMRILSGYFVSHFPNRMINIHHSFLPAFVGANPYRQAFERGVKMIGATAHFVTHELDQGPIIHQDVIHVNHSYQPEKLARAGQELEESVLLNALQLVIREKVFVLGNRTVVFN